MGAKDIVQVGDEKARILEIPQEAEVEDDAGRQNGARLRVRQVAIDDQPAETEIDRHREQEKEQKLRSPPRVIEERSQYQPGDRPKRIGSSAKQGISCQHDRQ